MNSSISQPTAKGVFSTAEKTIWAITLFSKTGRKAP